MKKLVVLFALAILSFLFLSGFVSAYYSYNYYPNGQFDSYSYSSSRSQGYLGGPVYTRSTDYLRTNSFKYLSDGTLERTIIYAKVTRESPRYSYPSYGYYSQPNYYMHRYGNYYW